MSFSLPPNSASLDPTLASGTLAELRRECDATTSDARRGILLHEIGILEDNARSEGQAARDLLTAVNALPDFHEPLERLMILIERRKSYKNLGKLVDRLVKIAESPEELARALVSLSEFREDHESDAGTAKEALERATQTKGDDVDAWLALERLTARTNDVALRRQALAARADLATDAEWRALLSIDIGKLQAEASDIDAAIRSVERAVEARSPATFAALTELERLGVAASRTELVIRSLEERAALIERALGGATDAEASGIPELQRSPGQLADTWFRAADLHRSLGVTDKAIALLDRVVTHLPDDPVATRARMRAAEAAGDTVTSSVMSQGELSRDVHGPAAAALWMRVTEAAASSGDATAALDAIAKALAEDPVCLPARTLELDLLSGAGNHAALASALEAAATQLGSEPLAAQFFLLAADTAARGAHDFNSAKASLSQAAASGASLDVVARTGRMLAALSNDAGWFDEATRRLLATNPPEGERASLWFETCRSRLLRNEIDGAIEAALALGSGPAGAWLGSVLRAYAVPTREPSDTTDTTKARGAAALATLAELTSDRGLATGFRVAAALRFQLHGRLDDAITVLRGLHEIDPADLVTTTGLATLYRRKGEPLHAADALSACAAKIEDPSVAAALDLEAGILRWVAGDRTRALDVFEAAAERSRAAGSSVLAWALRAAQPNDVDARRKALEAAGGSEDPTALALESFALEIGNTDPAPATRFLANASGEGTLGTALDLGRSLFHGIDTAQRSASLDAIAAFGGDATAMTRASAHFATVSDSEADARAKEASAARWSDADGSLASAIEWLSYAIAARDVDREIAARERIADRLSEPLASTVMASARIVGRLAHDDVDSKLLPGKEPGTLLTNLELSPPSCDPRRRAAALIDGTSALDEASVGPALGLAGWNLLAAGDAPRAIRAFRSYVGTHETDIVGWEGLRAAAELAGDKPLLAEASAALGDLVSDAGQGAELWERAATILLDDLNDAARGETALGRAVERDIGRHGAFDRLFRIVRARRDGPRLIELVSARLEVAEDPEEIAKLYWERARVLRESGDSVGAIEALENVTMLEPDHVGALALTGEIYIMDKRFAEAAESLARLASLPAAPTPQRLMSGVAAVDLYENRLGQIDKALAVLVNLHRSGLATLPVRERFARAAAKGESWEHATTVLEELMAARETREGRIEAARLAMALYRDRLGAPARAEHAIERLLLETPSDGEALDMVLADTFPKAVTRKLLEQGRGATIDALVASPLDLEKAARLAEIARKLDDVQLRQVALGAVVALGGQTNDMVSELLGLDGRIARVPQIAIDDAVVRDLRDPEDRGAIPELFLALATTLAEALGPGLAALGVTKKERVRPQDGLPVRNEIAAWAGALGLGEFELYVGGRDADGICAVATELPAVVVGASVRHPLSAVHRAALARELLGLRLGTTILRHRDATDVAALLTAACSVAGVRIDGPQYAMLSEFERQLSKELPRRIRKVLPDLANAVASSGGDPIAWVRAARGSLDRMAALAIGDVSWVLGPAEGAARGATPNTGEAKLRAARLLSFAFSPSFFAVRNKLGMGVR